MFTSSRKRGFGSKSLWKEGNHVHKSLSGRAKVTAIFVAMILAATFMASLLPEATASPSPVEIVSMDPVSGAVGETVRAIGGIDTANGSYRILFDGKIVKNGTSTEMVVNTTFAVPLSATGNHSVTLVDVGGGSQSLPVNFSVVTSYYVKVEPARIQEGLDAAITVGVNDAEANTTLTFTINVTDPTFFFYVANLNVATQATGAGSNSISYYEDFSSGATTKYVGIYTIAVVEAKEILASGNFSVGLTDRLEYGRTETGTRVHIRGAGYEPDKSTRADITIGGESVAGFISVADAQGVVTYVWQIPKDAQLGIYTVTLTGETGVQNKPIPDIQDFTVTEVIVHCQTQNKYDKETLAGVTVTATLLGETTVAGGVTNRTGWIELEVSPGNYTFKAFWKNVEVGSLNHSIMENTILPPIECELAQFTMTVKDETGSPLPFINVTLASNKTGVLQFETNSTGIVGTNTFTNASYTIEAFRYDHLFYSTQIANLTVTRWVDITCPTYTLFVSVLDSKGAPLRIVEVAAYEWSSGEAEPVQSETTDNVGKAVFHLTFGRYRIWVHNDNHTIVLNKTVVNLIEDQIFFSVYCKIFNLDLSVTVKDYFGHPIPNALVEVEREGISISSQKTGSKGIASFHNLTGGDCQISVSLMGKISEIRTLYLDSTKAVVFKLEKFVGVWGYPLEATQLIAYVSLGIVVALFALALTYRRVPLRKRPEEEKEKSL